MGSDRNIHPPPRPDRTEWGPGFRLGWLLLILFSFWALFLHLVSPILPFDDAYITFRYVDHFVHGLGLVYNEGQRVFGVSTPLYTLLLALVKTLLAFVELPTLAVRMNAIPFVACGLGVFLLVGRLTGGWLLAALAGCFMLSDPDLLMVSLGGMEPFVFLAFALFSLWSLGCSRPRPYLTGGLVGLAILSRPDGVVLLPIVLVVYWRQWKLVGRAIAAVTAVVLPWVLFSTIYFGTPIPLSIVAKAKPVYPLPPGEALIKLTLLVVGWTTSTSIEMLGFSRVVLVMLLLLAATFTSIAVARIRRNLVWTPAVFFWLLLGFYGTGNAHVMEWYLPAIYVGALLTLILGIVAGGEFLHNRLGKISDHGWKNLIQPACLTLVALFLVKGMAERYRLVGYQPDAAISALASDPKRLRVKAYRDAAVYLNSLSPEAVVAAPEIGAFGYYYRGQVRDACGLVSPEAHPYLPVPLEQRNRRRPNIGAISVEMVQAFDSDFVVTLPYFAASSLLVSEWFNSRYQLIHQVPTAPLWESKSVMIFKKIPTDNPLPSS